MNDSEFRRRAWALLSRTVCSYCADDDRDGPEKEALIAAGPTELLAPPFPGSRESCGSAPPTCGPSYHSPTCDGSKGLAGIKLNLRPAFPEGHCGEPGCHGTKDAPCAGSPAWRPKGGPPAPTTSPARGFDVRVCTCDVVGHAPWCAARREPVVPVSPATHAILTRGRWRMGSLCGENPRCAYARDDRGASVAGPFETQDECESAVLAHNAAIDAAKGGA